MNQSSHCTHVLSASYRYICSCVLPYWELPNKQYQSHLAILWCHNQFQKTGVCCKTQPSKNQEVSKSVKEVSQDVNNVRCQQYTNGNQWNDLWSHHWVEQLSSPVKKAASSRSPKNFVRNGICCQDHVIFIIIIQQWGVQLHKRIPIPGWRGNQWEEVWDNHET